MSFVLSQQQGWNSDSLTPVVLGPFQSLRNGVTGFDPAQANEPPKPTADFFMWEHFTTKPYFHPTTEAPQPPLKKFGEIFTPWPSWLIVASTSAFPEPANDDNLRKLFQLLDQGIQAFEADTARVVKLLGTGELGCTYVEEDAVEWLKDVKFTNGTRGVDRKVVENVINVLKVAGVIDSSMENDVAIKRVIGIYR
ncbi:hypothetical protein PHISCL_08487 [Aspergillus sclerotialis]|uniref:Ca3427-like PBP 2 domain-containing protein n=1 Tax=Aspergillus sclerotialis TaxID=2070753 RepID=A0A3A2ZQ06_9EURO|nr:hypothetical protein PHISCL_08487 [Aspergillus sclerotialis]